MPKNSTRRPRGNHMYSLNFTIMTQIFPLGKMCHDTLRRGHKRASSQISTIARLQLL